MKIVINQEIPEYITPTQYTHPTSIYENIFFALGGQRGELPVAEWLRRFLNKPEGRWFVISPIIWEASHNDATTKAEPSSLNISKGVINDYFMAFKEFTKDDFSDCIYIDEQTWLINAPSMPMIQSKSPAEIINLPIKPEMDSLDGELKWPKLLTEIQMLFHTKSIASSQLDHINGVWVWGCGQDLEQYKTNINIHVNTQYLYDITRILTDQLQLWLFYQPKPSPQDVLIFDVLNHEQFKTLSKHFKNYRIDWIWKNALLKHKPESFWWRLLR